MPDIDELKRRMIGATLWERVLIHIKIADDMDSAQDADALYAAFPHETREAVDAAVGELIERGFIGEEQVSADDGKTQ